MSQQTAVTSRSLIFHHDFRQLWIGDSISQFGTQVSLIALPYLAVTQLGADEFQMGVLGTLEFLAFLVIGLPAGAWVDRWRRQRVLISNDLIRAAALGSLPLAYLFDMLTLGQLFVVALVTGTATVFFDVAYQSYLPAIVDRRQITEGNSKLEISRAVAQVSGPGLGGWMIKILGTPLMIAVDAVSFLLSACFISRIKHEEPAHDKTTRRALRVEIAEGVRFVAGHPLLRRIAACTSLFNLFSSLSAPLLILFMVRDLEFEPGLIGLVFSAGAVGGLVGAVAATPLAKWVGEGRVIPLGAFLAVPFTFLYPLAAFGPAVPLLIAGGFGLSFAVVVYNVAQVSFRQRMCPPHLLGRMNATIRFLVWGTMPFGAFAGGVIGQQFSVVTALWVAAVGSFLASLPVILSPLIGMRTLPDEYDEHPDAAV
ncbi:MAG: MFS transporter [Geodermatophilaceae bacterium]|nr:MFS transporter [Geodermatophilaceae bacterium]